VKEYSSVQAAISHRGALALPERRSILSKRSILLGVTSNCDVPEGRLFASLSLDHDVLEALKGRTQCFSKAKEAYPELYETYEFNCQLEWYATGASEAYDDPSDQDKLQRLSYDPELGEGESYEKSLCADLDRLDLQEINSLVVPTENLPSSGNLRTESNQLVMSLYGNGSDVVDLRWICYIRHTDIELRTTEINSGDIDRWLAELDQEERPEAAISTSS
jgi:hypothetical protein